MNKIILLLFTFVLISCQVEKKSGNSVYIADHRTATNSFKVSTSNSGLFKTADVLSFNLSFPSNITVTGNPRLVLKIHETSRFADYVSGDGSKILKFEYPIIAGDNDSDGIEVMSIDLNGATLEFDLKGTITNCSTALSSVRYSNILIDNASPLISSISHAHPVGIYYWNDTLTFSVNFNEKVFVTGSPTMPLTFNIGGTKQATYASGSGTQSLVFKYVIANTVADTNGLVYDPNTLLLAGGTIKDSNGNDAIMTPPGAIRPTSELKIDGRLPKIIEVILPPNKTYRVAEELDFTVVFDRPVNLTGSPHLLLTVGSSPQIAEYFGGTGTEELTFRYIPLPGHVDLDGITLANTIIVPTPPGDDIRSLSGSTFRYSYLTHNNNNLKSPNTSGIIINAIQPAIERISRGIDTTLSINNSTRDNVWIIGQQLHIIAEFNTVIDINIAVGSPTLNFSIGGVPKVATYLTGGAGVPSMTFLYTVLEGDESTGNSIEITSIDLNNAVITDEAGTIPNYTIPNTTLAQTTIDGIRPTISTFTPPADGFYSQAVANRDLLMTAKFSEPVNLSNTQIGIDLLIGAITRRATQISGNNTAIHDFRYRIVAADEDSDGIEIQSPINVATYLVKDLAGNEMLTKTFPPPATPLVIVDNTAPKASVTASPDSKVYLRGETLTVELTFDEVVKINSVGGFPRMPITNLGPGVKYFTPDFVGLTQGTVFSFSYNINPGDIATSNIALGNIANAGLSYIQDLATNALTTQPSPGLTGATTVDAVEVKVDSTSVSPSAYYRLGNILDITLNFSEAVTLAGTPLITATVAGTDYDFSCTSGSGTSTIGCSHTITDETLRLSGIGNVAAINLNGGSIQDNNGIDATLTFTSSSLSGLKIVPAKFLSWSQGTVTDILSGTDLFTGSFTFTGTETLTATDSAKSIITKIRFDSATGSLLGGISYATGATITLTSNNIQSLRVNGSVIIPTGDDYDLGVSTVDVFILEIEFVGTAPTTLFDTNFEGQVRSILLLNSSLDGTERSAVTPLLN